MANDKIIYKKISKLREYISKLKFLQKHSFEEFEKNVETNWAVDRGLQLAIECSIDIGKEIIAASNFEKPDTYQQTFSILARHKVTKSHVSKNMQRLAKFRNELIHDYLYLDPKKIYSALQDDLKYFEEYLITIENYIKEQKN